MGYKYRTQETCKDRENAGLTNKTQVYTEKELANRQREEMGNETGHKLQNKTGNNKTKNSSHDTA